MSRPRTKTAGTGLASEPYVRYLQQVLEDLKRSELEVPRFQRPFVWQHEQRRELLRSVRDGIPMGSVLVWRTTRADVGTYPLASSAHVDIPTPARQHHYVLDGVQRLTTLLGALYPRESGRADESIDEEEGPQDGVGAVRVDFSVHFDLDAGESGDFLLAGEEAPAAHHLPLQLLYDSVALIKFQRGLTGPKAEEWIARADAVARAFREYKVPIIPIVTEDLGMATRTFQRVNSQGTTMSELHMLHALTWTGEVNILQRFSEGREQYLVPLGWSDLHDDVVVKVCKAALDFPIYEQKKIDEVSAKLAQQPATIDAVFASIARAARFLDAECGVVAPTMLPYDMQAALLADAFRINPSPDARTTERLRAWFWASTYGELFSAISGSRLDSVVKAVRAIAERKVSNWPWPQPFTPRPLPRTANLRGARTIAFALRLAEMGPLMASGDVLAEPKRVLAERSTNALVPFLPRRLVSVEQYRSPENRLVAAPEDAPKLRDRILRDDQLDESLLLSHAISNDAYAALRDSQYGTFLALRRKSIEEIERTFLEPLRGELGAGSK